MFHFPKAAALAGLVFLGVQVPANAAMPGGTRATSDVATSAPAAAAQLAQAAPNTLHTRPRTSPIKAPRLGSERRHKAQIDKWTVDGGAANQSVRPPRNPGRPGIPIIRGPRG